MAEGILPYKVEVAESTGATSLAGLPAYLELAHMLNLLASVAEHVHARENSQGWSDAQMVMSLVTLQIAGGECVDDLKVLEGDDGFCRLLQRMEVALLNLPRPERRRLQLQWRKERKRSVPSPSSVFRFLHAFDVDESERQAGKAWIPPLSEALKGLLLVNRDLLARVNAANPQEEATLDIDATLVECFKKEALHCYKGFKSYQPLQVYWAEQDLLVHSEFRDGNVPAGHEILRVLQEALDVLPESVRKVRVRSDSAAYQWDFLLYMARGTNERFGAIDFTVSADVTAEFRQAVGSVDESEWRPVVRPVLDSSGQVQKQATDHEYAEVCYAPGQLSYSKSNPNVRFVAIRERLKEKDQLLLPGVEAGQLTFPFPTMAMGSAHYKLHAIASNMHGMAASELILWHWARCGKSEEVHAVLKNDLAGGRMPSGDFGPNAAWWAITVIAYNLNSAMKRLVLGGSWVRQRMKAIRFAFIRMSGRVIEHARHLVLRLTGNHPYANVLLHAREVMRTLAGQT